MAEEKQVRRRRPAAAGAGGFQVVGFPKEFERGLTDQLDVRYYGILLGVMLFTLTFIIVSSFNELTVSDEHLQSIREDYLQKMYKVEIVDDTPVEEEITEDGTGDDVEEEESEQDKRRQEDLGKQAEVRGPTAAERATARRAAAAERARSRAAAQAQVASQGVLGILGASGGEGEGEAVVDILGGDAGTSSGDLASVLEGVGGLSQATSSGQRTRTAKGGGRVTSGAGIDELVEGIGTVGSEQISRKGKISISGPASVSGRGSKAKQRKPDVITRVIAKHQAAIDYCFKQVAKLKPNLKGEVLVRFSIRPNGRTGSIKIVRSTLNERNVERCMVQKIRGWADFPKIDRKEGDVTVQQKYIFGS